MEEQKVLQTFLKSDAYPKRNRARNVKTLGWVDDINCDCTPHESIWREGRTVLRLPLVLFCVATLLPLGYYFLVNWKFIVLSYSMCVAYLDAT